MSGNNSTYRTSENIRSTARRLISAARGNKQRQQRIRTIQANYLRAVGRNGLTPDEAKTNDAGAVLTKVRGKNIDYLYTASRTQLGPVAAKGNSSH